MEFQMDDENKEQRFTNNYTAVHLAIESSGQHGLGVTQEYNNQNRQKLWDSEKGKKEYKRQEFLDENGKMRKTTVDPLTGELLHSDMKAAQNKYHMKNEKGENISTKWAKHSAETDHIVSIKKAHDRHKNNAFLSDEDLKEVINQKENYILRNKSANTSKGEDSYVKDVIKDCFRDKDQKHYGSKEAITKAIVADVNANIKVETGIAVKTAKNVSKVAMDGGKSAVEGAAPVLVKSAGKKIMEVKKGNLSGEEAVTEIITETGSIFVSGAATSVVNRQIEQCANNISEKILKKSIPKGEIGKIVGVVLALKECTEKYANGEIDSGEYFIELIEDGFGYVISFTAGAVGEFFGGPIGAAICSEICSNIYNTIIQSFRGVRCSAKKLKQMESVQSYIIEKERTFQEQLQRYKQTIYTMREDAFERFNREICNSILQNDINGFIKNVNELSSAFGKNIQFETFEEFDEFMLDDNLEFVF